MALNWRSELKKEIEDNYVQGQQEWFDMTISAAGTLNLIIVSDRFISMPLQQRREQIQNLINKFEIPISVGFLSLYTPQEAATLELARPSPIEDSPAYSWFDLAQQAANISEAPRTLKREPRIPRTITFYSFKGGVGRTTALIHVAVLLAMRGRKVVAVDLDLEAPGLSSTMTLIQPPQYGIVDYFYERSYIPQGVEPTVSIAEIFGEVSLPDVSGRLFIVPAGSLNLSYIAKADDLRAAAITEQGEDLWATFYREITEQLQPDVILVDSRTGLNEWGAFSLLRAADQVILFMYPNEQNRHGVSLLLEALAGKISPHFVFSLVPFVREGGMEMVERQWEALKTDSRTFIPDMETAEPIVIPYVVGVAMADNYPMREVLSYYAGIANIIDEETNAIRLSSILANTEYRKEILESLEFVELDMRADRGSGKVSYELFQRTADFDKFLDNTVCLIRGHIGTGKSTLYWLLLKHRRIAADLSYGQTLSIECFSGHGAFRPCPAENEFQRVDQALMCNGGSWEAFWRSYLLLRMYLEENYPPQPFNNSKFLPLHSILSKAQGKNDQWGPQHTDILIEIATHPNLDSLARDLLRDVNTLIEREEVAFWFLYDDLDKDLKGEMREKALIGLFQLVRACRGLRGIRFKVFLREDIWSLLAFDGKSYFNGRNLFLQWTLTDFLRLALRLAFQSEKFKGIVNSLSPIENIDQTGEDLLNEALQLLWGSRHFDAERVSGWIYKFLCDINGTTFPHLVSTLLQEAKQAELQIGEKQPVPTDRLLSIEALQVGLVKASQERYDEIRQEYPALQPFFDALVNKSFAPSAEHLQAVWQETTQTRLPDFGDLSKFISFLESIGFIALIARSSLNGPIYGLGPVYQHFLGWSTALFEKEQKENS